MDLLSLESLYAQYTGPSSPSGCDVFDVDSFFVKNDKTKEISKDALLEDHALDNALVYMEETLDLDKLTELSALTSKDINDTTIMVSEGPEEEVHAVPTTAESCSSLYYYNYEDNSKVQCEQSLDSSSAIIRKPVLDVSNLDFGKLAAVLPAGSEDFLQNLLYESEANTLSSSTEYIQINPLTPTSPSAVVPGTPGQLESDCNNSEDDSTEVTKEESLAVGSNSPKQRILLPKGTIAYTLDLIPGTNTYVVTESRVPVPENTATSIAGTLSNEDMHTLGISCNTSSGKKEFTSLDALQVPYQLPVVASPEPQPVWNDNMLQVPYPSSSPSPASSDSEYTPSSNEWVQTPGTPYGTRKAKRSPQERKMRKMEQNKTAAVRYRRKKHEEMNNAQMERDELRSRNVDLNKTASDLSLELKYIKKLLKEVCQAKGLLQ